jgi:hypothetical protein
VSPVTSGITYGSNFTAFAVTKRASPTLTSTGNLTVNLFPNTTPTPRNVTTNGFNVTLVANATGNSGEFATNYQISSEL